VSGIYALGQDESGNKAVEMIVMPSEKILTICLVGIREPQSPVSHVVFFLLSAIMCDILMVKNSTKSL
jgi:hypothetical protein